MYKRICEPKIHFSLILALARHNKSQNRSRGLSKSYFPRLVRNKVYKMYSVFFLWFIASSLLMTSANIFNGKYSKLLYFYILNNIHKHFFFS